MRLQASASILPAYLDHRVLHHCQTSPLLSPHKKHSGGTWILTEGARRGIWPPLHNDGLEGMLAAGNKGLGSLAPERPLGRISSPALQLSLFQPNYSWNNCPSTPSHHPPPLYPAGTTHTSEPHTAVQRAQVRVVTSSSELQLVSYFGLLLPLFGVGSFTAEAFLGSSPITSTPQPSLGFLCFPK